MTSQVSRLHTQMQHPRILFHGLRFLVAHRLNNRQLQQRAGCLVVPNNHELRTHCTICHDRATRALSTNKQEILSDKTLSLEQRIEFGDINLDYYIDEKISFLKKLALHKLFKGNYRGYLSKKKEIADMKLIEQSRLINKKTGTTWL